MGNTCSDEHMMAGMKFTFPEIIYMNINILIEWSIV